MSYAEEMANLYNDPRKPASVGSGTKMIVKTIALGFLFLGELIRPPLDKMANPPMEIRGYGSRYKSAAEATESPSEAVPKVPSVPVERDIDSSCETPEEAADLLSEAAMEPEPETAESREKKKKR